MSLPPIQDLRTVSNQFYDLSSSAVQDRDLSDSLGKEEECLPAGEVDMDISPSSPSFKKRKREEGSSSEYPQKRLILSEKEEVSLDGNADLSLRQVENINALPPEILTKIFCYVIENGKHIHRGRTIQLVCRLWSEVYDLHIIGPYWAQFESAAAIDGDTKEEVSIENPQLKPAFKEIVQEISSRSAERYLSYFFFLRNKFIEDGCSGPFSHHVRSFEPQFWNGLQEKMDVSLRFCWRIIRRTWESKIGGAGDPSFLVGLASNSGLRRLVDCERVLSQLGVHLGNQGSEASCRVAYEKIKEIIKSAEPIPSFEVPQLDKGIPVWNTRTAHLRKWIVQEKNIEKLKFLTSLKFSTSENYFSKGPDGPETVITLHSLPPEICKLPGIRSLAMNSFSITRLPYAIGELTSLVILNLSHNTLQVLPDTIGNLHHLVTLNLSYNELGALPDTIGTLRHLVILNLSHNKLRDLPDTIENLNIRELQVSHNALTHVPKGIIELIRKKKQEQRSESKGRVDLELSLMPNNPLVFQAPADLSLKPRTHWNFLINDLAFLEDPIDGSDWRNLRDEEVFGRYGRSQDTDRLMEQNLACANHSCATTLASLCKQIHLGKTDVDLHKTFERLSSKNQELIRTALQEITAEYAATELLQREGMEIGQTSSSSSSSSQRQERLFIDRSFFVEAVMSVMKKKLMRNESVIGDRIAALAQESGMTREDYITNNIIRFIDIIEDFDRRQDFLSCV